MIYNRLPMLSDCKAFALRSMKRMRDIFFPAFCFTCTAPLAEHQALCQDCLARIRLVGSKALEVTPSCTMQVYAVGAYEDPLKKFVLAKSYSDISACYYMAQLMHERCAFAAEQIDYIVPIPLHRSRYAKRGYNQSDEIAKQLSRLSGLPVYDLLRRRKATIFQSQCDKEKRFENVKDAFEWLISPNERKALRGKRLLLVDDVMTTGATLAAAAKVLAQAKPEAPVAVVLARV